MIRVRQPVLQLPLGIPRLAIPTNTADSFLKPFAPNAAARHWCLSSRQTAGRFIARTATSPDPVAISAAVGAATAAKVLAAEISKINCKNQIAPSFILKIKEELFGMIKINLKFKNKKFLHSCLPAGRLHCH